MSKVRNLSLPNNEWEEELVEKFASTEGIEMLVARTESIKSFIHSLLSLERQKLRKLIMNSELDTEAHSRGRCSFPLMSICSAEEHRIKMELLKLLEEYKLKEL